ncbi:MAG: protein-disulfide reductase DsbD domain-containing protein [Hyphomicrobium sp.]
MASNGERRSVVAAATLALVVAVAGFSSPGRAAETQWQRGFNADTRLYSALVPHDGVPRRLAFLELKMPSGWKTYWRNPGDAGGLPPRFGWERSENLAAATVLYPVPERLSDEAGETIGYKEHVTFPVLLEAKDASKPIRLAVDWTFGICKDVCVPLEAAHELEIESGDQAEAGSAHAEAAAAALEHVPRLASARRPTDPRLRRASLDISGAKPKLVLEAEFPGAADGADAFVEAPDGLYVPMLSPVSSATNGATVFAVELGAALDPADLAGKTLTATLIGRQGQTEATFKLD